EMEQAARGGEILLSSDTAAHLPVHCIGDAKGPGMLLREAPPESPIPHLPPRMPTLSAETLASCLSVSIRAHVLGGGGAPEHRPVTIAFIRFEGTDALVQQRNGDEAAD